MEATLQYKKIAIKELMKKIMTEPYNPIPPHFSDNMKQLIADMLIKDPNARPSIRDILQKKFLAVLFQ